MANFNYLALNSYFIEYEVIDDLKHVLERVTAKGVKSIKITWTYDLSNFGLPWIPKLLKRAQESVELTHFDLSCEDLKAVMENSAQCEKLALKNCKIMTVYENFCLDPKIDYKYKELELWASIDDYD